jgi:hypothetical protein
MDNFTSVIAGGGISGLIFTVVFLIFKYLEKHKVKVQSGCCKLALESDSSSEGSPLISDSSSD